VAKVTTLGRAVGIDLGALPLSRRRVIVPQKGRPATDDRGGEVQWAGKRVTVRAAKVPVIVKAAGTRQEFIVKKPGWQR
jgi:hypothetical protein